ncbi:MAG TPA: RAMP superfamily CRISPR-associated protein [Pyrinomonadaceae bacterium]|jgi:CRISPR/Cas system CSM-associated protein Csm3 (group 7 of RAMP superfamily)
MARKINSRLRIYGTLQAETPLHVGGYGVDVDTDLPLARNGKGELYVPGTSLTGVLRAWCEKNFGENLIKEIFGFQETDKNKVGTSQDKSHASFVLIEDAVVTLPPNLQIEIRDGVGIDRFCGTAADKSKFDRAILPKGSQLNFEMTVEIKDSESSPQIKAIFGHLLDALQKCEIRFGASKTRGLGKIKLTTCEIKSHSLNSFDDILSFLSGGENTCSIQDLKDALPALKPNPSKPTLEISIKWQPALPLMNKAGYEGIGVDMLPVTSGVADGKLSLVLAGSSIKGAFRSHAERIVRTLKPDIVTADNFNEQIIVPIVSELFGGKKEKDNLTQPKSKLGLGALSIDDCYSVESFDPEIWREVEQGKLYDDKSYFERVTSIVNEREVEEVTLHQALRKLDTGKPDVSDVEIREKTEKFAVSYHTAIDRFTGGVAEGALYSVLAPHNIEWQTIKMSLDFGRAGDNGKCCLMLLLLVLRDLAENRLPLGFATNRGMGEIKVEWIKLESKNLAKIGLPKALDITLPNGDVREIDAEIKESLKGAWDVCLK